MYIHKGKLKKKKNNWLKKYHKTDQTWGKPAVRSGWRSSRPRRRTTRRRRKSPAAAVPIGSGSFYSKPIGWWCSFRKVALLSFPFELDFCRVDRRIFSRRRQTPLFIDAFFFLVFLEFLTARFSIFAVFFFYKVFINSQLLKNNNYRFIVKQRY